MSSGTTPTLRTIARSLGLSRTTVSDALRGSPRVNAETMRRVREAATQVGYQHNALAGAVMSQLRRSRGQHFRGVLATIEHCTIHHDPLAVRYSRAVQQGIHARAAELGFKVQDFSVGTEAMPLSRLDSILHARGIQGLVILPALGSPDFSPLTWERYAAIYTDYLMEHPPLHCVCSNHYHSMVNLCRELHSRGYRRPGLFMEIAIDERLHFRWEGAFLAMQKHLPETEEIPLLRISSITKARFCAWFKKYRPDVVLGHFPQATDWMRDCGAQIPGKHGFVCLNRLRTEGYECASMEFPAQQLGARATELVISQLLNNELGIPKEASLTTLPIRLVEGPTLRAVSDRSHSPRGEE